MSLPDSLSLVGTSIADKYAIECVVGEGGFAIVYRATHTVWKRPVAVKVFKALSDVAAADRDKLLEEFIREGALLAELSERSAAIVQARDVGMVKTPRGDMVPYMVLEWLEGATLEAVIAEEKAKSIPPRSIEEAVHLLNPAAEALALAHAKGIAHRDVKPANVFVLGDPREASATVKLLDFGIAKVVQDAQKMAGAFQKTSGQITSFTPAYGAPEQFTRTHGATGPWTDVFALALVVVEVLTQRDPLDGDDFLQLGFASSNPATRPTPRTRGATVSDAVEAIFVRALAVKPQDRFATAGELWNELRLAVGMGALRGITGRDTGMTPRLSGGEIGSAPTVMAGAQAVTNVAPGSAPLAPAEAPPKKSSRGSTIVFASLAAIGVAGFAFGALRNSGGGGAAVAPSAAPSITAITISTTPAPGGCPLGMVKVPGGEYYMGSDEGLDLEKPAHHVKVAPFCIDRFEVTVAKYKECSDRGACKRASNTNEWVGITEADHKTFDPLCNAREPEAKAKHPINCVDWDMAEGFCEAQDQGRLPTEAEWEFAARGSDGRKYPWGDDDPSAQHLNACGTECVAWGKTNRVEERAMYQADDGFPNTAPVGSFPKGKSSHGLEDVVGNVWEWVGDWYAPYPKTHAHDAMETDPKGPSGGTERIIRGGSWNGWDPAWVRPTFRFHDVPAKRSYGIGFRCAKAL